VIRSQTGLLEKPKAGAKVRCAMKCPEASGAAI